MAIIAKPNKPGYNDPEVMPWDDPNAYGPVDPNAPGGSAVPGSPTNPGTAPYDPTGGSSSLPWDEGASGGAPEPGVPEPGSGNGSVPFPIIPDGAGGSIPVPPIGPGGIGPVVPDPIVDWTLPPAPSTPGIGPGALGPIVPDPDPIGGFPQIPAAPVVPSGSGSTPAPVTPPPVVAPDPVVTTPTTPTAQAPAPWSPAPAPTQNPLPGTQSPATTGSGYTGSYSIPAGSTAPLNPVAQQFGQQGTAGLNALNNAPSVLPGADPRLLRFQQLSDDAIQKILNGPDRLGLAKSYYDIFDRDTEGDYTRDLKQATDLGAARGRLGSGLLTNSYGDLFERRASDKDAAKQRLLTDALQGTIQDRQNAYSAISDAESMAFGQGVSNRAETRTERDARLAIIDRYFDQQDAELNRDLQYRDEERGERAYGDDLAYRGRNEERTDQAYQDDQAQQALLNRIRQQQMETEEAQRAWDNAMDLFRQGLGPRPAGARPTTSAVSP